MKIKTGEEIISSVQFTISEEKFNKDVKCIAVGKIDLTDPSIDFANINKVELVRRTLLGSLFQQNYRQVPLVTIDELLQRDIYTENLLKETNCDAIVSGEIYKFKNESIIAVSSTEVGLDLKVTNADGEVIWSGRHAATSREGSLPFSPLSLLSGVFLAQANAGDEVALQMVDAVVRRLVNTMPRRNEVPLALAKTEQALQGLFIPANGRIENEKASPQALLGIGQYEKAIEAANFELELGKNVYQNYLVIGDAERNLSRFQEAVESYLLAIASDNKQTIGYEKLSLGYLNLRRIDLAKASLSKAISLKPESSKIRYQLAVINESQKALGEAVKLYFQAGELAIREKDRNALYSSLAALNRLSQFNKGLLFYNSLVKRAEKFQDDELRLGT